MSFSRYTFTPQILGRRILGTPSLSGKIHRACDTGQISYRSITLTEGVRLDHLSGRAYGTASLWWVIAAASGIGWCLQVPAGTLIRIPTNPGMIMSMMR